MAAWNVNDTHAFASQFTEDGTFVNVTDRLQIGQKAIGGTGHHRSMFTNSHVEIKPERVRLLRPDVALVHAHWILMGDSRDSQPRDYLMTLVVAKRGARWLIIAAQNGSAVDRSASSPGTDRTWPSPLPTLPAEDRTLADVRKLLAEVDSAWTHSDAKALANLFTEDADLVNTTAQLFHGRAKIEEYLRNKLKESFPDTTSTSRVLTTISLGSDLVVFEVRWELRVNPTQDDPPKTMTGLRVVSRENGRWRITAEQDTVNAPFPPQNP
jgi:uncharacterized protein (TIGR02246 family)